MHTFARPTVGAGAMTLDAAWYTSPAAFATERERIFSQRWILVGREEQIDKPGDYFVADVNGESIIVTRDSQRAIHAFYNVCRHRGTRVCEASSGHFQGSIQCPYHAWTYGLDGTLKAARNMAEVSGFDRSQYPLHESAAAAWEGFIFVNLSDALRQAPREAQTAFDREFAPLIGRFAKWDIANLKTARTIHYDLACNWKLVFLNYSECYHCPLVHPQLDKLSPSDSGRNDLSDGPFLGGYSELRAEATSLTTSGHTSRPPLGSVSGDDVNRIYYYTIFPSMLLSLHADYVMVHYAKPVGPDRTEVRCAWLFDAAEMAKPGFDPSDAVDFWDLTNRQDWHVNELTQLGMQSRAYTPGPYSNAEGLLTAFDRYYLSVMR
ncbi:MAG: aromatic ring-hydroxylating dioxygenase subunit alpha [Candidatus Eremiobacteraeota bacterium]|nr:aromatic ring-hydroxylating dioxygenase subunit alpha [Candidatus Eremiobacteraeota bacterium]